MTKKWSFRKELVMSKKAKLGIALILIAVILGGAFLYITFAGNSDSKVKDKKELTTSQREESDLKLERKRLDGRDVKQNDREKKLDDTVYVSTKVRFDMPESMKAYIPMENLDKLFYEFLSERKLMTTDTIASFNSKMTMDFQTGDRWFTAMVNNYGNTVITVHVKSDDTIEFEYR